MSLRGSKIVISACQNSRNKTVGVFSNSENSTNDCKSILHSPAKKSSTEAFRAHSNAEGSGSSAETDAAQAGDVSGKAFTSSPFIKRSIVAGNHMQKVFQDVYLRFHSAVKRSPSTINRDTISEHVDASRLDDVKSIESVEKADPEDVKNNTILSNCVGTISENDRPV